MKDEIVFQEKLLIGNNDSLMMFGISSQQALNDVSKKLASIFANNNGEVEDLINHLLDEIEIFQSIVTGDSIFPWQGKSVKRNHLLKKYYSIINDIDKMELALKLQEVQLLKESKSLESLVLVLEENSKQLENAINYGKSVFKQKTSNSDDEVTKWFVRLSNKLDDLNISYILSIQSQTQVKLMLDANKQLIDKIISAISETIPIWRNQVTFLIGAENEKRNIKEEHNITKANGFNGSKSKNLDITKLSALNIDLKTTLEELENAENRESDIYIKINNLHV